MAEVTRRVFLQGVGRTMLLASAGLTVFTRGGVAHLDLAADHAVEPGPLDFGAREPLVRLLQETALDRLLPLLVKRLREGEPLESLVAAAALANARTFGGEDYDGYHAMFAMLPALGLAARLGPKESPLPVLKVVFRNTERILKVGGRTHEVLHQLEGEAPAPADVPRAVLDAVHHGDVTSAEKMIANAGRTSPESAYRALQPLMRDTLDIHQVALAWRAWDLLRLTGPEHAATLLRTAVREACDREQSRIKKGQPEPDHRAQLPKLIAQYKVDAAQPDRRRGDDAWVGKLADTLMRSSSEAGASAVAEALSAGFHQTDIGEALSLASTRLLLHDAGLTRDQPGKPIGSVHGASIGLHASDAAHAWRNIARVMDPSNRAASLMAAAWHTAGQGKGFAAEPMHASARAAAAKVPEAKLLDALSESVTGRDQRMAAALAERAPDANAVLTRLLPSFLENEGALHHEKYFATQSDILAACPPSFRSEHLAALARVAASGAGFPAASVVEARKVLSA